MCRQRKVAFCCLLVGDEVKNENYVYGDEEEKFFFGSLFSGQEAIYHVLGVHTLRNALGWKPLLEKH